MPIQVITSLAHLRSSKMQAMLADVDVGVTIGNFDGMHVGHQELFSELQASLQSSQRPTLAAMLTFTPHPKRALARFRGQKLAADDPQRLMLTPPRIKAALAERYQFSLFFPVHFTSGFASQSAREFVTRYLCDGLKANVVVVGYDWSFGKAREGTAETLAGFGSELGFRVSVVPPVLVNGIRVSSSAVKDALRDGDIGTLTMLLGRPYAVAGRVMPGHQRGQTIGVPTANLHQGYFVLPAYGVYATRSEFQGRLLPSITNVGVRPTVGGGAPTIETHILTAESLDLYGKELIVHFIERIRNERKFDSLAELKSQIAADILRAQQIHGR